MLSNLMTGVVNLSVMTLFITDIPAFAITLLYQFVVIFGLYNLLLRGIKVKFW
jgi:hypothetical protein